MSRFRDDLVGGLGPDERGQVEHADATVTVWAQLTERVRRPVEQAVSTESMCRIADAVAREFPLPTAA